MKTRKYYHYAAARNIRGFSLIEFLVASILSMIVLIAAGSGFFMARQLNDVATARLQVQQDLRHAANMIVRDARMAGSFGCFNMANVPSGNAIVNGGDTGATALHLNYNASSVIQNTGVKVLNASGFTGATFNNFVPSTGNALVFQYGVGSTAVTDWQVASPNQIKFETVPNSELAATTKNTPLVVSSCAILDRLSSAKISSASKSGNTITLSTTGLSPSHVSSQLSVLRYVVHVYLIGKPSASEPVGFYRFELGLDGKWVGPQLLVKDVSSMALQFGYVKNCDTTEVFDFTNAIKTGANNDSPTLLRVRLNNNVVAAEGRSAIAADAAAGNVGIYDIHATIRGGNVCADRSL